MAKTMFFNNVEYTANDFVDLFRSIRTDGIISDNDLKVTASSPEAMTVDVAPGVIFVNGYFTEFKITTKLNITSNTSGYGRKDRICVKVDSISQTTEIIVIEGIPSSSPQPPTPPVETGIYYLSIAIIYVGNNISSISSSNVYDVRKITRIWDDFNAEFIKGQNGYLKFPNGLIIQWGRVNVGFVNEEYKGTIVTYPITFPNDIVFQSCNTFNNHSDSFKFLSQMTYTSNSQASLRARCIDGNITSTPSFCYIALGY